MIRTVLDTNVWVSGFLTPVGTSGHIIRAWRQGRFEVVISEDILQEMGRLLIRPKIQQRLGWTPEEVNELLFFIYKRGIATPGKIRLRVVKDDPTDDKFFVAAVEGEADYIVSGDAQVHKVKRYRGIKVLSPAEFLERLKQKEQPTR